MAPSWMRAAGHSGVDDRAVGYRIENSRALRILRHLRLGSLLPLTHDVFLRDGLAARFRQELRRFGYEMEIDLIPGLSISACGRIPLHRLWCWLA
jgi:hypothetical protein